jgi:hypothetical protein
MADICQDCRNFRSKTGRYRILESAPEDPLPDGYGECHFNPPSMQGVINEMRWPLVNEQESCSNFDPSGPGGGP